MADINKPGDHGKCMSVERVCIKELTPKHRDRLLSGRGQSIERPDLFFNIAENQHQQCHRQCWGGHQ